MNNEIINDKIIINQIKSLIFEARQGIEKQVNTIMLNSYWNIGKIIVEFEQSGNIKAEYGKQLLKNLSKELIREIGTGFSVSNLQFMRRFYLEYPKQQTLSVKLSWSHYCELLSISDIDARNFYEKECQNSNWSVRELKRQIDTSLFQRLLLSDGNANKQRVIELASRGGDIQSAK